MKCLICNRLTRALLQGTTGLLECPYCGYTGVIRAGIVVAKINSISSVVFALVRKSQTIHE